MLYLSNWFSVSCIGLSYLAFMFFNHSVLSPGTKVNLTITVGVSLMIALVQSHHNVVELTQRQEINKINRQLETLLEQDRMLGILNKSAFEYRLKNALELVDASNHISALMLDLDDFKNINDRYGHPCGDYVLLETARTLKEIFSREDQLIDGSAETNLLCCSCIRRHKNSLSDRLSGFWRDIQNSMERYQSESWVQYWYFAGKTAWADL